MQTANAHARAPRSRRAPAVLAWALIAGLLLPAAPARAEQAAPVAPALVAGPSIPGPQSPWELPSHGEADSRALRRKYIIRGSIFTPMGGLMITAGTSLLLAGAAYRATLDLIGGPGDGTGPMLDLTPLYVVPGTILLGVGVPFLVSGLVSFGKARQYALLEEPNEGPRDRTAQVRARWGFELEIQGVPVGTLAR